MFLARSTPFRLGVVFDGSEVSTADTNSITSEAKNHPGGILGFKLQWYQVAC